MAELLCTILLVLVDRMRSDCSCARKNEQTLFRSVPLSIILSDQTSFMVFLRSQNHHECLLVLIVKLTRGRTKHEWAHVKVL